MKYHTAPRPTVIVAIDPGLTGAVAILRKGKHAVVYDTPSTEVRKTSRGKLQHHYDPEEMVRILEQVDPAHHESVCVIEYVSAMPKQGVTGVFRFGYGAGLWRGIAAGLHIPVVMVTPQTWKKAMLGARSGDDKSKSLKMARKLFPSLKDQLARAKDDGRADALLIAEWFGRTQL